jgi:nucleotidyltransferase substrate binding protein (TIGR01987 family)
MSINFEKFEQALSQLKSAVSSEPANDLERDGVIQRFEYTIELLWKVAKKVLEENGVQAIAPKEVIREMANIGWVNNPQDLIEFLKMRNETSHSYKEEVAKQVYEASKKFATVADDILKVLKEKAK